MLNVNTSTNTMRILNYPNVKKSCVWSHESHSRTYVAKELDKSAHHVDKRRETRLQTGQNVIVLVVNERVIDKS